MSIKIAISERHTHTYIQETSDKRPMSVKITLGSAIKLKQVVK